MSSDLNDGQGDEMTCCERCWSDAYLRMLSDPSKTQADHYCDLIEERKESPCTPEQQRGERKETK